uniref:Uncharacterized protein n=1 Tax=Rhizophora mucronata TaxID=61149 RepID=A0A2P2Q9I0_RHIMU
MIHMFRVVKTSIMTHVFSTSIGHNKVTPFKETLNKTKDGTC